MSARPVWMMLASTRENRAEIWFNFQTVFDARKFCRGAKAEWNKQGIWCKITSWGVHRYSGEYQVIFMFSPNTDAETMIDAISTKNPPSSNRGVTS